MSIQLARKRAEQLIIEQKLGMPPINVEYIAKQLKMLVIHEELEDGISGLLITKEGMVPMICVQNKDHSNRKRFTVAHEIGHFVLQHQFQKGGHVHIDKGHFISQRGPRASTGDDLKEIEANQFAASLLMPTELVKQQVLLLGEENLTDTSVGELARSFQVSEQAITIRLETLGFL
jgi:Zn-dependent peptidase ImmA (M78 family)